MFKCYYSGERFRYIHAELQKSAMFDHVGAEKLRKTATCYGPDFNVYIDTSDGVNEDLDINEYCGRILKVVEECDGKPFLFFKAAYSPEKSKDIIKIAEENDGKVVPFFKWSFNDDFYSHLVPNRRDLMRAHIVKEKTFDVGLFSGLAKYNYPKPDKEEPRVAWTDHKNFGLGSGEDTGCYEVTTRQTLHDKLKESDFNLSFHEKLEYEKYLENSFSCKVIINPPGMGEYTSRMFDQCFLGQCVVLRKTTYDFGHTTKNHLPEVDFDADNWQEELQEILDNHNEWAEKAFQYFQSYWTPQAIVQYLITKVYTEGDEL